MAHTLDRSPPRHSEQGFTLIEILVAVLVLSFGLLGLAMLQATGLRYNTDSYMRSQATILAYDLIDRMRANKAGADAGHYCLGSAMPVCETTAAPAEELCGDAPSGCASSAQLAQYDLSRWYTLQKRFLSPGAQDSSIRGEIVTTPSGSVINQYTVTMRWSERDINIEQSWVIML